MVRRARVRASPRGARELDAERDTPSRLHGSGPTSCRVTTFAGDRRATDRERAHVGRAPACDRTERSGRKRVGALLVAGAGATPALATDRPAAADAFGHAVAWSRARPRDDRAAARSGARTRSTDDARPRPAVSDRITLTAGWVVVESAALRHEKQRASPSAKPLLPGECDSTWSVDQRGARGLEAVRAVHPHRVSRYHPIGGDSPASRRCVHACPRRSSGVR
jgi:hypothetical protein